MKEFTEFLKGNKTYIMAAMIAIAAILHQLGYLDESAYQTIIGLLVGGAASTFAAKVNRIENSVTTQTQKMDVMNKKLSIAFVVFLFLPTLVFAQSPPQATPTARIGWDQVAVTLVEAQEYTYKYYADSSTTGVQLQGVTCVGTASPFVCSAPFPAFTPGNHSMTLTASNLAGESEPSNPFAFAFVVTPGIPSNLRIVNPDGSN